MVTYNRPKHTQKVIDALRLHRTENLFVLCDAPKSDNDATLANEVFEIVASIDWTRPRVIRQTSNQGLARSVVQGVNLALETFEAVILLEDDCVPQKHFFDFHFECLRRYADDSRVMGISGYTIQLPPEVVQNHGSDIYFFPRMGSWGWSTWKGRWLTDDRNLARVALNCLEKGVDLEQGGSDVPNLLGDALLGKLKDTWTLPWLLNVYSQNGLYIYPTVSHVDNIGFDGTGIHCGVSDRYVTRLADSPASRFPLTQEVSPAISALFCASYQSGGRLYPDATLKFLAKAPSLKIVHLCAHDHGGAGTAAFRLHQSLCNAGVSSSMLVLSRRSEDPSVHAVGNLDDLLNRSHAIARKYPGRSPALETFSDAAASLELVSNRQIQEADIINLHWVPGLLDHSKLSRLLASKPVVWTLHDMNPFTGGCHYTAGCRKFEQECGSCPQLASDSSTDLSRSNFLQKKEGYRGVNLHVVTPSHWLQQEARKSTLLADFPSTVIPNGFPIGLFYPLPVAQVRKILGIPVERQVVLFGCERILNTRKGFKHVLKTFSILIEDGQARPLFCFFGHLPPDIHLPKDFMSLGTISDPKLLSAIYSMADVFLIPSLEDNLPNVVPESLLAGTPVVGFDVGGIPDMVLHKRTGYLAPLNDTQELANGVRWVLNHKTQEMRNLCRAFAAGRFSQEIQAIRYIEIYSALKDRHRSEFPSNFSREQDSEDVPNHFLVNLGCGSRFHPFWKNFDIEPIDGKVVASDLRKPIPLPGSCADVVYHSHLLEHLSKSEGSRLLADCYRILKPGGIIRIAVPDLEQLARLYIEKMEKAVAGDEEAAHQYDWVLVEMLDSMTRAKPGGAMLDWWISKDLQGEAFVHKRMGQESFQTLSAVREKGLLPTYHDLCDPEPLGKFRLGGEVHLWMYDRYSLTKLLIQNGFSNVSIVSADSSQISGFNSFFLDCDADGRVRRPDSLFVEAFKT